MPVLAAAVVAAAAAVGAVGAVASLRRRISRAEAAVDRLELPPAVFTTCPWQPRELVETGLRQWLRCCAPALGSRGIIGMPSRAADEAWHGLILCTARYSAFCQDAYGTFLDHHPADGALDGHAVTAGSRHEQLRRTVVAWTQVAGNGERCVLWDLDERLGLADPWGIDVVTAAAVEAAAGRSRMCRPKYSSARGGKLFAET